MDLRKIPLPPLWPSFTLSYRYFKRVYIQTYIHTLHTYTQPGFDVDGELLNGRNPLHYAADYGQVEVLKYLLTKNVKIDVSWLSHSYVA